MLQQTTVKAVIPYYKKWVKAFPNVQAVARAPRQKILKVWQGLGYYQRAKNIHRSAKIITRRFAGKIPQDPARLSGLPGFGPYTTGAVLSIAFDHPHPIIDANIRRVVMRLLCLKGPADRKHEAKIYDFLSRVFPKDRGGQFNQALMELGALVCRNHEPICNLCPVKKYCRAFFDGVQEIIPSPRRKVIESISAVVALIRKNGAYFIQKRGAQGLLADLWEFPGGKIERGESAREALQREIKEELKVEIKSAHHIMVVVHYYTRFKVTLNVWRCHVARAPRVDKLHKWVPLGRLPDYPMPSGSTKIVNALMQGKAG